MESMESPLEVLSRAATMVQDSLPNEYTRDESTKQASTKQLPTTKWKRDRRRLPEYSRKFDIKATELSNNSNDRLSGPIIVENSVRSLFDPNEASKQSNADAPIDMSVRQRGLPPSYAQTINSPGYKFGYKSSSAVTQDPKQDLPSGISMCDPIIDEHFRRSLGKDYSMLFHNDKKSVDSPVAIKKSRATAASEKTIVKNNNSSDTASLSVDDHFAKALGDTWLKLNTSTNDVKVVNGKVEKNTVVTL